MGVPAVVSTAPGHDALAFDLIVDSPGDALDEPVEVRFTAGADVPCVLTDDASPRTYRCGRAVTDADSEGERIVIATVTDAFGNVGEVRENVVVDRTAPDLIDDQLIIGADRRDLTLELRFDEPIASASLELVGSAASVFTVDIAGGAVSGAVILAVEDAVGAYTIDVIATDRAGNTLQRTLSFDQEAPVVTIDASPALVSIVDGHNTLSATVIVTSPGDADDEVPWPALPAGKTSPVRCRRRWRRRRRTPVRERSPPTTTKASKPWSSASSTPSATKAKTASTSASTIRRRRWSSPTPSSRPPPAAGSLR